MEFVTDSTDYSVPDFFENFSYALPKVVIVSQGFCGDILQETFDRDQVLRIHTYSKQKRVIARKCVEEGQGPPELFSLPLNYPIPLCVVKQNGKLSRVLRRNPPPRPIQAPTTTTTPRPTPLGDNWKVNREKPLADIVRDYQLPVDVQFSKSRIIPVGGRTIAGERFPQLKLTDTFEEMYMLGNCIISGVLQLKPEVIPLYLSGMRLVEVVGLKDQESSKWKQYTQALSDQVTSSVTFDTSYGNENIAVYHPESIRPDCMYCYITPTEYTNIAAVLQTKFQVKAAETDDDQAEKPESAEKAAEKVAETCTENAENEEKEHAEMTRNPAYVAGGDAPGSPVPELKSFKKLHEPIKPKPVKPPKVPVLCFEEKPIVPPPIAPKPKLSEVIKKDSSEKSPPAIPERNPKVCETLPAEPSSNLYDNDIPRGEVTPTRQETRPSTPPPLPTSNPPSKPNGKKEIKPENRSDKEKVTPVDKSTISSPTITKVTGPSPDDIASMTISDVSEWMEKLKLSKYVSQFQEEMIDGSVLLHLDEETLREDFGMKRIECVRLMTFAKEGHVPT